MRWVPARDAFHAGVSGEHGAAEGLLAESIRADDTHSGDDDAWKHRSSEP